MPNSTLLQLMGLPPDEDDISYDICLDLSNASWDEVSSRITTHPSEALEEDCLHGNSPLEILLKSKSRKEIPLDVYRKILEEGNEDGVAPANEGIVLYAVRKNYSDAYMTELTDLLLDYVKHADGRRLIEMSIWYGNVAAATVVINRFPDALHKKDNIKGRLPLHVACEESNEMRQAELIELLLMEGIKHKVGGKFGAGGLFEKDYKGTSPLMQIIHAMNNPFTWDETLLNLVVKAAFETARPAVTEEDTTAATATVGDGDQWEMGTEEDNPFHLPILHEAMGICSPDAFYRVVEIVKEYDELLAGKDKRGRTALIRAIYLDSEERQRRTRFKRKTSTKEIITMIIGAVTSDCAKVRDGAGRLPIHIATEMGLKWSEGIKEIVYANKCGLEERHTVTGIYPYMTAAAVAGPDLDTIFELMRQKPKLPTIFPKAASAEAKGHPVKELSFRSTGTYRKPVHWPLVHNNSTSSTNGSWGRDSASNETTKTNSTVDSDTIDDVKI